MFDGFRVIDDSEAMQWVCTDDSFIDATLSLYSALKNALDEAIIITDS